MSSIPAELDDQETQDTWPAFVDLFSATSLLFIALVGVFIYLATAQRGIESTTNRRLRERLEVESQHGRLFVVDTADRQFVRIVLRERATFPVGKFAWETLRPEGKLALERIGQVLNDPQLDTLYREVRVIGHTDQVPLLNAGFTNWELSAARAAVVARYLVNWVRVDPCKISATGRGPYFPVSKDIMEANRRIEIQIVPRLSRGAGEPDHCEPAGDGVRAAAAGLPAPDSAPSGDAAAAPGEATDAAARATVTDTTPVSSVRTDTGRTTTDTTAERR